MLMDVQCVIVLMNHLQYECIAVTDVACNAELMVRTVLDLVGQLH